MTRTIGIHTAVALTCLCGTAGAAETQHDKAVPVSTVKMTVGAASEGILSLKGGVYAKAGTSTPLVIKRSIATPPTTPGKDPTSAKPSYWSLSGGLTGDVGGFALAKTTFGTAGNMGAVTVKRAITANKDFATWAGDGSSRALEVSVSNAQAKSLRRLSLRGCSVSKFEPLRFEGTDGVMVETLTLECQGISFSAPTPAGPLTDLFTQASSSGKASDNPSTAAPTATASTRAALPAGTASKAAVAKAPVAVAPQSLSFSVSDAAGNTMRTFNYRAPSLISYSIDGFEETFEIQAVHVN
jgi:hypothetical protein